MKTREELIAFEERIAERWNKAEIPYPVHFSGGNEEQLIKIFSENIRPGDYVFSTHRSHYHYLLAGGSEEDLEAMIERGESMHVFDKELNFLSSSIVSGLPVFAVGTALALKLNGSDKKTGCLAPGFLINVEVSVMTD